MPKHSKTVLIGFLEFVPQLFQSMKMEVAEMNLPQRTRPSPSEHCLFTSQTSGTIVYSKYRL